MTQPYNPQYAQNPYAQQQPQQTYPAPGYAPQAQFQQPQYQNSYPQQPPQQQAPQIRGTLSGFASQPADGWGPAIKFPQPGSQWAFTVARDVLDTDVFVQTDPVTKQIRRFKDGNEMLEMRIPVFVQPSQDYPEGKATWYVQKAQMRGELSRAMISAGYAAGEAPRKGDQITIIRLNDKPSNFGSPAHQFQIPQYIKGVRDATILPAPEPEVQVQQTGWSQPQTQTAQAPQVSQPQVTFQQPQQAPQYGDPQQQVQYPPVGSPQPAQVQPQFAQGGQIPNGAPQIPGLTPEEAATIAQLTNGQVRTQ